MSLFRIAMRSIQQRGLASLLTSLSMALGVLSVVVVLSIHGLVSRSFYNNASFGYNMIVGPKGGSLQLTLNSVYYLSEPIENIPYDFFLEFLKPDARDAQYAHSIQRHAYDATWSANAAVLETLDSNLSGLGGLACRQVLAACEKSSARQWDYSGFFNRDVRALAVNSITGFGEFTDLAIPLCLGDYYGRFRVVGTTPAMFEHLRYGESLDRQFEFSEGRNFQTWSEENQYFEAVVGAMVAREMDVELGSEIAPAHGASDGAAHAQMFTVVGILAPTGTPQDRGVFINMEGFFLMEDHAKPIEEKNPLLAATDDGETENGSGGSDPEPLVHDEHPAVHAREPLPVEQREVTAVLLRVDPNASIFMENQINEPGSSNQAVFPIREIVNLFDLLVRPIQLVLLGLTAMICLVSGVGILVSIYNSMTDRRQEIAIMRALGAGRGTVMSVILLEALMLAMMGGLLGWVGGHAVNAACGPWIEAETGVEIGFFDLAPSISVGKLLGGDSLFLQIPGTNWAITDKVSVEFLLIPALMLLAVVVGFLPALSAYRTDVAVSLRN